MGDKAGEGRSLAALLLDIEQFRSAGSGQRLCSYQLAAAQAILDSVLNRRGLALVVMFPRQSGKNELQAQIEAYLLTLLSHREAEIVEVPPTWKPQSLNAMRREERVLEGNALTAGQWKKEQGYIFK